MCDLTRQGLKVILWSAVSGSSPSGVQGSALAARAFLQLKCNFIAVLMQFLVIYEEI